MLSHRCIAMSVALILATHVVAQDNTNSGNLPVAKATPTADSGDKPLAKAVPSSDSLASRPLSATITLANQSVIRGTLTDTTDVEMKTSFGEVTIPLSEVAGIRFASAKDSITTVVMLNGDSVTGATDVKRLVVETEWGAAQVNGASVASIMLVPSLQWSSVAGLNGKRWYLTEQRSQTTPSRPNVSSNQPSGNRYPQNGIPINSFNQR